jgi:hypothetical protein
LKAVEDLRHNNADLAKTLSGKEQKIQDLERALADQKEASGKDISEIINKLKVLFKEYEKSLMNFSVLPAPLPADIGLSDFMKRIETEFKALPEVITGASDFAAAFSVESILKFLHDFDCADLVKFRENFHNFLMLRALQDFVPMKTSSLLRLNLQENSGLPAGGKSLRTSLVLSLTRLSSWKCC